MGFKYMEAIFTRGQRKYLETKTITPRIWSLQALHNNLVQYYRYLTPLVKLSKCYTSNWFQWQAKYAGLKPSRHGISYLVVEKKKISTIVFVRNNPRLAFSFFRLFREQAIGYLCSCLWTTLILTDPRKITKPKGSPEMFPHCLNKSHAKFCALNSLKPWYFVHCFFSVENIFSDVWTQPWKTVVVGHVRVQSIALRAST